MDERKKEFSDQSKAKEISRKLSENVKLANEE